MNRESLLITGSSGFLGKHLISSLEQNNSLNSTINRVVRDKVTIDPGMISYNALFNDLNSHYDTYIHLAGKAHDVKHTSEEDEYFEINYELTKKLFDHFLHHKKAKVFIFVSTVKAVADEIEGKLDENHENKPSSAYGRSKLKAEEYITRHQIEGKKVFILRPCMIHGPGNKGNLNLLYNIVSKGIPWPLGAYDNRRSFLSVDNFCFVINEILKGSIKPGVYHLADDETFSTNEVVEIITRELGLKPRIWDVPQKWIQLVAKIGNTIPIPLNEERLAKLTENYVVSNHKLLLELGKPLPVSAKAGLMKTIQSFKR